MLSLYAPLVPRNLQTASRQNISDSCANQAVRVAPVISDVEKQSLEKNILR